MEKFVRYNQESSEKEDHPREFQIQAHHIQYETNDSQASDTSYQSSLSSNQENSQGNAQYFREEMSRFFINYPELLNHQLVGSQTNEKSLWGDLANDIINQAKEQPISLQGIAKRIAFYRQKTEEIDIIDLIVKEKDLILKELDEEARMFSEENLNPKAEEKNDKKNNLFGESSQNAYYSWKKKYEVTLRNDSRKNLLKKSQSSSLHTNNIAQNSGSRQSKFVTARKPFRGSKQVSNEKSKGKSTHFQNSSLPHARKRQNSKLISKKEDEANSMLQNKTSTPQSNTNMQLKNMLKFQPKTEIAKQLVEEIKKHNINDQIGIKKTIVNFLARHREAMKKNILNKSNLNERLSKLHIEDSKELLLFCPLKKGSIETDVPLNTETNNFLEILNEISTGHLMKYWKLLQQRKL